MGMLSWLFGAPLAADALEPAPAAFAVDAQAIPPQFFGLASYTDTVAPVGRVSRESAIQAPAVKRTRDLICSTLAGVPLQLVGPDSTVSPSPLLEQPERYVARVVTMSLLVEDLLFEGVAWWRVRENDYRGFPTKVERLAPQRVSVSDGRAYVDGRQVSDDQLIRFDSPNDPLLVAGGRAIRTLLRLEASAATLADDPAPQAVFSPADGEVDPAEDDEIQAVLDNWNAARKTRSTGYVPAALKYESVKGMTAQELQMVEARQHAVLEIARLTGISAEDLSVSTTSRTYFNAQQARMDRISDVLQPYSLAITDRLKLGDVTPRGYSVRADFSSFLRADDATRLANYKLGLDLGLYTLDDIAAREGLPFPGIRDVLPAQDDSGAPVVTVTQLPRKALQ